MGAAGEKKKSGLEDKKRHILLKKKAVFSCTRLLEYEMSVVTNE